MGAWKGERMDPCGAMKINAFNKFLEKVTRCPPPDYVRKLHAPEVECPSPPTPVENPQRSLFEVHTFAVELS